MGIWQRTTMIFRSKANKALDKAGFAIVSSGMRECLASGEGLSTDEQAAMEKLFLSLA